jgi:hypothetical protein
MTIKQDIKWLEFKSNFHNWVILILFFITIFSLLNPHFVKVKVNEVEHISNGYKAYYYESMFHEKKDFILDTLSYECMGNPNIEDELDIDKSKRCNKDKKVYCQGGFYIRFSMDKDDSCIVKYQKYETQFRIGID